jgi:Tfp pilus assembly protein PilX
MVLLTVMFVLFAVGMMLFGFMFLTQSALEFATLNRDSTVALGLAEAGAQESLARLAMAGAVPGTTAFINSLAGSGD